MPLTQAQSDALLLDYARGQLPLTDLAASAGLSLSQFLEWAESPPIAALLDALEAIAHRHARLAAAIATTPALKLLDQLVDSTTHEDRNPPDKDPPVLTHRRLDRELGRKAASTIIAVGKPPRPKKPMPTPESAAVGGVNPAHEQPTTHPSSQSRPETRVPSVWTEALLAAARLPVREPPAPDLHALVLTAGALAAAAGEPSGRRL